MTHYHAVSVGRARTKRATHRVATRNYELDSHCYHLELHYLYWRHTADDAAIFADSFLEVGGCGAALRAGAAARTGVGDRRNGC